MSLKTGTLEPKTQGQPGRERHLHPPGQGDRTATYSAMVGGGRSQTECTTAGRRPDCATAGSGPHAQLHKLGTGRASHHALRPALRAQGHRQATGGSIAARALESAQAAPLGRWAAGTLRPIHPRHAQPLGVSVPGCSLAKGGSSLHSLHEQGQMQRVSQRHTLMRGSGVDTC